MTNYWNVDPKKKPKAATTKRHGSPKSKPVRQTKASSPAMKLPSHMRGGPIKSGKPVGGATRRRTRKK